MENGYRVSYGWLTHWKCPMQMGCRTTWKANLLHCCAGPPVPEKVRRSHKQDWTRTKEPKAAGPVTAGPGYLLWCPLYLQMGSLLLHVPTLLGQWNLLQLPEGSVQHVSQALGKSHQHKLQQQLPRTGRSFV